ncbi:MAG: TonB-dependent receptor [Candidatus Cryptobacteroides sp.]
MYATSESGSYGDAKLNIRGFSQENISVSLNGIPISGLTSGGMYWNNWMGLAGATSAIQVQKGAGASMLTDCSVGGSVNIVTNTAAERMSLEVGTGISDFGTGKVYLQYSSGQLPHGWSILAMGSYVGGQGYVDCTDINSFAFMLNVNKTIDRHNTLSINFLGSPEQHGQRSTRLSPQEVQQYGTGYSKDWGWRDGEHIGLQLY